jgi:putative heme transporter
VSESPKQPAWVRPLIMVAILVVCGWIVSRIIGTVDWAAVGDALGRLALWQFLPLFAMLMVRQVCNALPLAFFTKGITAFQALMNDLTAALMALVAPPPSDMVMRVAMFNSWGVESSRALAGATMNTISFYINRFAAPIIGLAAASAFGFETDHAWFALAGAAISIALVGLVYAVLRADGFATRFGLLAGRTAQRFRSTVDPDAWAGFMNEFRSHINDTYRTGFPRSLAVLVVMVIADALILLMSLRFVGVSESDVPALYVIAIFFLVYPLTLFPLMGLGVMDTVLLAAFLSVGGEAIEPEVIAAFAVWRVVTLIAPVVMGAGALTWWRRTQALSDEAKTQTG